MKASLALVLSGIALVLSGCTDERPFSPPASEGDESSASDVVSGRPRVQPGGYYSLFYTDPCGYCDFQKINMHNGTAGEPMWALHVDPYPGQDPEAFGPYIFGVTFDVDGLMYGTLNLISFDPTKVESRLARIDSWTGDVTIIGDPVPFNTAGSDIDACGNLYVCGFQVDHLGYIWGNSYLWRIDKTTGEFTQIGDTGHTNWMDLAFDSQGTLWGTFDNELYTIDTETGASTLVTPISGVPDSGPPHWMEVMSIAFDQHDVLYGTGLTTFYVHPNGSPVMRIDIETGSATLLGYSETQDANHGGDIMPMTARVAHQVEEGVFTCIEVGVAAIPEHLAHGDYVPGSAGHEDCGCP